MNLPNKSFKLQRRKVCGRRDGAGPFASDLYRGSLFSQLMCHCARGLMGAADISTHCWVMETEKWKAGKERAEEERLDGEGGDGAERHYWHGYSRLKMVQRTQTNKKTTTNETRQRKSKQTKGVIPEGHSSSECQSIITAIGMRMSIAYTCRPVQRHIKKQNTYTLKEHTYTCFVVSYLQP